MCCRRPPGLRCRRWTPGSGKSTLLTQALTGSPHRLVRYYAYVPRRGPSRSRLDAHGFLHDIVLMLRRILAKQRLRISWIPRCQPCAALYELLDLAATDYAATGTKTIIVVDGLDHVQRDHPGADSLLDELPLPEDLGEGVVFVVGTLYVVASPPTHPATRRRTGSTRPRGTSSSAVAGYSTYVDEPPLRRRSRRWFTIESPTSRLDILACLPAQQVGPGWGRSRGARRTGDGDSLTRYVAGNTANTGDYLDGGVQQLLAVVARLRIAFTYNDLIEWFGEGTARTFRTDLVYLFRAAGSAWTVFHDSFRQYVISNSNLDDSRPASDPLWMRITNAKIAQLCETAHRAELRWEELYHRYRAGQDFRSLSSQSGFRETSHWAEVARGSPRGHRHRLARCSAATRCAGARRNAACKGRIRRPTQCA